MTPLEHPPSVADEIGAARRNPFATELALTHSSYAAYREHKLQRVPAAAVALPPLAEFIHDSFRALVLNLHFSCVGAKSAVQRGNYRVGVYGELGSAEATAGLSHDLCEFVTEWPQLANGFATFVASFTGPNIADESQFEQMLWAQLQALHDLDCSHYGWDSSVSSDPDHGDFSWSFAERAFFVVGLHPASSRWTRRFAWPTLVFNAHEQFEQLRADGRYARIQEVIRARERALQGSINANLSDFGDRSEARQYSGRPVEAEWRCPFHTNQSHE